MPERIPDNCSACLICSSEWEVTHKGKVPSSLHFTDELGMYCRGLYAYVSFPKRNAGPYILLGSGTCTLCQCLISSDCKGLAPIQQLQDTASPCFSQ